MQLDQEEITLLNLEASLEEQLKVVRVFKGNPAKRKFVIREMPFGKFEGTERTYQFENGKLVVTEQERTFDPVNDLHLKAVDK